MPNQKVLDRLERTAVRTAADVVDLVGALLECAIRRQCWLFFLEERGKPIRMLFQIDDLPYEPDHTGADALATVAAAVIRQTAAAQVLIAWERPGTDHMYPVEWSWVHAAEIAFADAGIPLRGQVVLHSDGVRWIALDRPEAA